MNEKKAYEKAKERLKTLREMSIEDAEKAYQQAKARYEDVRAKASQKARKADTRRKIILGGILLREAELDMRHWKELEILVGKITREIDKTAFKDWTMPAPPMEVGRD